MESDLKEKLVEAVQEALKRNTKREFFNPDSVYKSIRPGLAKRGLLKKLQTALMKDAIAGMLRMIETAKARAETDPEQLVLPGFEHLPARIRSVTNRRMEPLKGITVTQLLAYKERYERKAEKDQRVVEELRKLADTVAPFASTDPDMTVEAALARAGESSQHAVTKEAGNTPIAARVAGA